MKELNFIKTLVSKENFKEREVVGNITFIRLDANEQENGMMLVTECSVPTDELDESELSIQYEAWKEKVQAAALEQAKKAKIAEIVAYDQSSAVNAFYLNGEQHWLDFNLRDRVFAGNERIAYKGREETSLWLDGKCFVMPIAAAQDLICTIEVYAKDCYNVTATHQAEVNKLTTIEEVKDYDYKTGYPEKLNLKV